MEPGTKIGVMRDLWAGAQDNDLKSRYKLSDRALGTIKIELHAIKDQLGRGKSIADTAEMLTQPIEVVESVSQLMESGPPPEQEAKEPTPEVGKETELPSGEPPKEKKEAKAPTPKTVDRELQKAAEKPTGKALMEDAGNIGKELAIKRQEIGKYVIDTIGQVASEYGFPDHKVFLEYEHNFFINNYGLIKEKDELIEKLIALIQQFIIIQSERNRRVFLENKVAAFAKSLKKDDLPVRFEDLLAYSQFLDSYFKPVDTAALIKSELGEVENYVTS